MRRITSIILVIAFVVVSITGIQLATTHIHGDSDKQLPRKQHPFYPKEAHQWAGFLFVGTGLVHIGLNNKLLLSYLKHKS